MPKKTLQDTNSFLKAKYQQSKQDIQKIENDKTENMQEYLKNLQKEKEFINISLLDDAPSEWNFFPALNTDKLIQMEFSILENGVLNPIICWKQHNGRYMILSGHNRVKACKNIIEKYGDSFAGKDFSKIPAIIFAETEITPDKASQIIIDTNYIQRGEMSKRLRSFVTKSRMETVRNQKSPDGKSIDEAIAELDLGSKSSVYEDVAISTKIIPELANLYFDNKINRKAVLKFSLYGEDTQRWIFDTFKDRITNDRCQLLNKRVKMRTQIENIFCENSEIESKELLQFSVPSSKKSDFKKICNLFLKDPEFEKYCISYLKNK